MNRETRAARLPETVFRPLLREAKAPLSLALAGSVAASLPDQPPPETCLTTTASDVRDALGILKKRRAGLPLVEATDPFKKRVLSPAKVAAYEFWGLVRRDGDQLTLSRFGWECARQLAPETQMFRALLDRVAGYRALLEWARARHLHQLAPLEVLQFWQESGAAVTAAFVKASGKSGVVSFFHLCQAAELGSVTLARRGQPARLKLERAELDIYLNAPPAGVAALSAACLQRAATVPAARPARLLFSHGVPTVLCEQLQAMLTLAEIELELLPRETGADNALPLSAQTRLALQRSAAALILIDGAALVRLPELHALVSAAWLLYADRLLLLWQVPAPLPASWRGLPHYVLDEAGCGWETGLELLQVIKGWFQRAAGLLVPGAADDAD